MAKPIIDGQRKKNKCTIGFSCSTTCINPDFVCEKNVQTPKAKQTAKGLKGLMQKFSGSGGGGGDVQMSSLRKAEAGIVNQKYETGVIVNNKGKEVLRKDGKKTSVDMSDILNTHSRKEREKLVLTHNHPVRKYGGDGASFSAADIRMAHAYGLKGIRAVDKKFEYDIKTNLKKSLQESLGMFEEFGKRKTEIYSDRKQSIKQAQKELYRDLVNKTGMTVEKADFELQALAERAMVDIIHDLNVEMSKKHGYGYTRTERRKNP